MVDNEWRPEGEPANAPQAGVELAAQINVLAQYTKDLSFENPNAPRSLQPSQQPAINLQINVNSKPLSDTDFEVELTVEGKAEAAGTVLFTFELVYAGIFRLTNVPKDAVQAVMMIECPRLLFPLCARDRVVGGAQWRLPAADDRPGRFRGAVSPEDAAGAGGSRPPRITFAAQR